MAKAVGVLLETVTATDTGKLVSVVDAGAAIEKAVPREKLAEAPAEVGTEPVRLSPYLRGTGDVRQRHCVVDEDRDAMGAESTTAASPEANRLEGRPVRGRTRRTA
ncbi:hypothetical protein ACFVUB_39050 [Streptomyces niveus]|uniref:hypothetical protein n=1 Tax=Streptomyces niveus TaxID=193462 RepID=UPI0036DA7265